MTMAEKHNADPQQRELLRVCRIGRAQGLKGEVNVRAFTDEPEERFAPGSVLLTEDGREFEVVRSRKFKERWIVLFKGVTDRNASEALNGTMLYVEPTYSDDEDDDGDDGFYAEELIGLEARIYEGDGSAAADSDAAYAVAGKVTDVMESPAQWLLTVTEPSGAESLVPFVEEIVPEVDPDEGYLVLTPPNGLLQDR
ncbi:ribosome maturation factor RimM [Bifidobacterium sp. SMB2]|uniref:Ribosome maturation factor RimM n=1 Tax=Bifidobacterium saimiriisciurei TaxID=2661627 RepID=A0ABX0CCM7_9BIFI|nr:MULTISPECIES: ribosome maturation factor RimM [Bifidobacterium]NEG96224.1 ribosome maturation factor RimM [Bifidobacterium sp. SMB2]NEH12237.1 ribosome maturation factor RimM [Bifidobacterium saimiriisciurei]